MPALALIWNPGDAPPVIAEYLATYEDPDGTQWHSLSVNDERLVMPVFRVTRLPRGTPLCLVSTKPGTT